MLLVKNLGHFYIAAYLLTASKIMATFFYLEQFNCSYYFCLFFEVLPEILLILFIIYILIVTTSNVYQVVFQVRLCFCVYFLAFFFLIIQVPYYFCLNYNVLFVYCWINSLYTIVSKIIIVLLSIIFLVLSRKKLKVVLRLNLAWELPLLLTYSLLFMLFLTSSYDFFGLYLSIEGLSLTLYVLSALISKGVVSIEATVKYFSLGAMSTGILLLGISIMYALVGSLDFLTIQLFLGSVKSYYHFLEIKFSIILILVSFFFKLSMFPCHIWVADVYEGVWTPITFFLAVVVKVCLVLLFIRLFFSVLFNIIFCFQFVLCFVSIGSMLVGAFGALKQTRIKRFLAYTSVNQVGFLSLGIASCSTTGLSAIFLYLIIYIFMNIIFFSTLLNTEHIVTQKSLVYLSDFYSYSQYNSKGSKTLVLTLMSMSGLPPLGGFFAKLYLYLAILEARLDFIFFFSLIISVYSTYYYLSLVRHILFEKCLNLKVYYCVNSAYTENLINFSALVIIFYPIIIKVSVVWWFLKACF